MGIASKALVLSGVLCLSPPVFASANEGHDVKITARVPAACNIVSDDFVLTDNGRVTGWVREFCNTGTVYHVYASYRPLATSESGTIRYGLDSTSLDKTGLTMVAVRHGQRLENVAVEINTESLSSPLAIAFTLSEF